MKITDKILVTGASGQVGTSFQKILNNHDNVFYTDRSLNQNDSFVYCDLSNEKSTEETLSLIKPSIIINCAAYTAVDLAEKESEIALKINAQAVETIAKYAKSNGSMFIHYSTDYVFDGSGFKPWTEYDLPNPLNIYGKTKLAGEQAIQSICPEYGFIFRTQWVYAKHGKNFLNTMIRLGQEREELSVVGDQIGAPTTSDFIAKKTLECLTKIKEGKMNPGIYNLVCGGETSWFGFAEEIFKQSREQDISLKIKAIKNINSIDYPTPAVRPKNSRLDLHKIEAVLGSSMSSWQDELKKVMNSYK